jgi:broad specificity phosphatase PhoE
MSVRVCFIRHGPDSKDPKHPHDELLSTCPRERAKMEKAAFKLYSSGHVGKPARIYTSPFRRTKQTAALFANTIRSFDPQISLDVETMPQLSRFAGSDSKPAKLSSNAKRDGALQVKTISELQNNIRDVMQVLYRKHAQTRLVEPVIAVADVAAVVSTPEDAKNESETKESSKDVINNMNNMNNVNNVKPVVVWCFTHGSVLRQLQKAINGDSRQEKERKSVKHLQVLRVEISNSNGDFFELVKPRKSSVQEPESEKSEDKTDKTNKTNKTKQSKSRPDEESRERHKKSSPKLEARNFPSGDKPRTDKNQKRSHSRSHHSSRRHGGEGHRAQEDQRHHGHHGHHGQHDHDRSYSHHQHHDHSPRGQHNQNHNHNPTDPGGFLQAVMAPLMSMGRGQGFPRPGMPQQSQAHHGSPPQHHSHHSSSGHGPQYQPRHHERGYGGPSGNGNGNGSFFGPTQEPQQPHQQRGPHARHW